VYIVSKIKKSCKSKIHSENSKMDRKDTECVMRDIIVSVLCNKWMRVRQILCRSRGPCSTKRCSQAPLD